MNEEYEEEERPDAEKRKRHVKTRFSKMMRLREGINGHRHKTARWNDGTPVFIQELYEEMEIVYYPPYNYVDYEQKKLQRKARNIEISCKRHADAKFHKPKSLTDSDKRRIQAQRESSSKWHAQQAAHRQ